jgi:hypothetical protein
MHSFWDDLFALRGFKDAAIIAAVLGKRDTAALYRTMAAEFRTAVVNAYQATMRHHGIDYLAGAVELGDFDPTSTTVALNPVEEEANLPRAALLRTFERYWEESQARAAGTRAWEGYTPYELRSVGAFVRLGQRERAHAMLDFFFRHQRPSEWRQWAEVVWNDSKTPKFIGDMPHTWVASDFIRSALDMFAYEREADSSLVLAAGIPLGWVRTAPGVGVRGLSTHYGPLTYTLREESGALRLRLEAGVRVPPGGIIVQPPLGGAGRRVTVNGRAARLANGEIVVRRVPADVMVRY